MSIINKIIGGGGGSGGLSQAQVDARVVVVAGESLNGRTIFTDAIADDDVWSIDFGQDINAGNVIVTTIGESGSRRGIFAIRARSSPFCVAIAATGINATTGVLTGTTGSDGVVTISTHTDNKLYIENRSGGATVFNVTINIGQGFGSVV